MGNLSNLYISRSYQSLIHLETDNTASSTLVGLQDGLGNSIGISVNTSGSLSISGSFTASLANGYAWVGDGNNRTSLVPTSSFGSVTSAITGSSLITASFSGNTLTFTKGDSSQFGVVIPDVSGSTINTGSFATTGSNTFNGDQIITGSLNLQEANSAITLRNASGTGEVKITSGPDYITSFEPASLTGLDIIGANLLSGSQVQVGTITSGIGLLNPNVTGTADGNIRLAHGSGYNVFLSNRTNGITNLRGDIITLNGSSSLDSGVKLIVKGEVIASGSLTASLQQGYVWVGNSSGTTTTVPTSSLISDISSLNAFTSSQNTKNSTLATYTASIDTKFSTLATQSGSWVTEAESGSFLVTASVNLNTITFTKGNNTTFDVTIDTGSGVATDLGPLNAFTASQEILNTTFATTGSNTFTGNNTFNAQITLPADSPIVFDGNGGLGTLVGIRNPSGSLEIVSILGSGKKVDLQNLSLTVSGSGIITGSLNVLGGGNVATTGSNTFVGNQVISGSLITTGSIFSTSGSFGVSNTFTALDRRYIQSFATENNNIIISAKPSLIGTSGVTGFNKPAILLRSSSLATYYPAIEFETATGSNTDRRVTIKTPLFAEMGLTVTGSLTASLANGFTFVGNGSGITTAVPTSSFISTPTDISALNAFTQSQETKNSTLATYTASVDTKFTAVGSSTASLNSYTSSQDTKNSTLSTYTASIDTKFSTLGSQSGSWITESETGSFARTNVDNNFSVNQTFTNITAVSASFTYLQTTFETSSVIYSSGSNQFGDELSDIQTLSGSVKIQGSLTINGTPVLTSSVDISSLNAFTQSQETKNNTLGSYTASVDTKFVAVGSSTASLNSYTSSQDTKNSTLGTYTASVDTKFSTIGTQSGSWDNTALNSFTQSQETKNSTLATYTGSNDTKWNTLGGQTGSYVTSQITGSSLVTASVSLNTITFTKGDASTFNITVNTGSAVTTDISSLNSFTQSQDTKNSTLASYTASVDTKFSTIGTQSGSWDNTSLNSFTQSVDTKFIAVGESTASLNAYTQSNDTKWSTLGGLTGSYVTSAITGSSLVTASFSGNTLTFTKGDSSTFGVIIPDVSGSDLSSLNAFTQSQDTKNSTLATYTGSVDTKFIAVGESTSSLNAFTSSQLSINTGYNTFTSSQETKNSTLATYTGSVDTKFATIGSQSGSWGGGGTDTGSLMVTGSVAGNVLTFTKGDSSQFSLTVATGSGGGGSTDTGSLLVTASFNGTLKEITFTKGDTNQFVLGGFATTGSNTFRGSQTIETSSVLTVGSNEEFIKTEFNSLTLQNKTTAFVNYLAPTTQFQSNGNFAFQNTVASVGSGSMSFLIQNGGSYSTTAEGGGNIGFTTSGSSGGNIGFTTNTGSISSNITNGGNYSATVNGGGNISLTAGTGSVNLTTPGEINLQGAVRIRQKDGNNPVTIVDSSGSLLYSAAAYTSASLHLSQSTATQNTSVNFVFKTNNNTPDTIISGSNNIFTNPAAPTAGFKRYFGGSGNIVLGTAPPQISGSMGFSPTMNNNIWGGTGASPTMRGPISSSAWTISSNVATNQSAWNIGTSATLNAQQIQSGFNAIGNIGSVVPAVQAYKTPLSASVVFSTNSGTGQISMNCDSSSIQVSANTFGGGTTINNSYFPATINSQTGLVQLANSNVFGTSIINASGSDTTFTAVQPRGVYNSIIGGYSTIGLVLNGDNAAVQSSAIIGGGLVVTGSNSKVAGATANGDYGSAFFGRWNAQDGNRAISGPTVFAVGTGTSTSARKTGFLIDSGSNTFIEGTLNVSGSTTITGSLNVTSLIVSGSTQFNVGAFNSTITQSGSAAVSQSMTFNNTDITEGVTLNGGGTQLTLTNSGTYNIQFSAQLLAATGQDDVYIWLKKNGTNVSNTATKLVLANNEANVAAWNFVVPAAASDYFELVWQSRDGHTLLSAGTATGNIPAIPSVIVTVTQVR